MKNIKRLTHTATFFVFTALALMLISPQTLAQTAPPPNNGTTGSGGGTPVGGGAPLGSGLMILLTTAGAYAYAKWQIKTLDYSTEE